MIDDDLKPWLIEVPLHPERDFVIDNLLVRIHSVGMMIWWTGLAPGEVEFSFPGSLTSTSLGSWLRVQS